MRIHLIDGTYELFRHFYAMPSAKNRDGEEVAAVRGVMYSIRGMVQDGATHIGVATDHVIESFRNALWPGYKTGDGIDPALRAQFPLLEEALRAWGLTVWPMVEVEADDALASAAAKAALDPRVDQVIICSPDKDLAQCVHGTRVVQHDRVRKTTRDEAGVVARFGVPPAAIPDYLALVGDTSDGFPGLSGWGAKSAATVLAKFNRIDAIPEDHRAWGLKLAARRVARGDADPRPRHGSPLPAARHAADGRPGVRVRRRSGLARTHAGTVRTSRPARGERVTPSID